MPRGPRVQAKAARGELTPAQELALVLGDNPAAPVFASDAEMREAWEWAREGLLARVNVGARPSAWWRFESSDGVDRDYRSGLAWLIEHNELTATEVRQLAEWEAQKNGGTDGHSDDV